MTELIKALATGCYLGYLPLMPGTYGSALAIPLHFLLVRLPPLWYGISLAVIILIAIGAAGSAEKIFDRKDPREVVIDEVVGMLVTLIHAPSHPVAWLLGFVLFRFFDILKPFPIRIIDQRVQGGVGIVLDDLVAGVYANLVLHGVYAVYALIAAN